MMGLIKNEYIKLGLFKIVFPIILFSIVIILEYYLNKVLMFEDIIKIIPYVGIVLCIIFSGIVSNEIESGTFRFYLTKSISRVKILTSKLLAVYIYTFIIYSFILILFLIISDNIPFKLIIKYYEYIIPIYTILSCTFFLSNFIKNTPINLGMCILLFSFGGFMSELLLNKGIKIIEYTLLPYFDFSIFLDKLSINAINLEYGINLNISYAIFINIVHIFVFIILSYFIFSKKDIKY